MRGVRRSCEGVDQGLALGVDLSNEHDGGGVEKRTRKYVCV